MKRILQQLLTQLSHGEKIELLSALKAAIAEELAGERTNEPRACPRCGCVGFVKKGRSLDKGQRWLCRGCNTTFSQKTMGLLSRSKLDAGTWMTFAECMADVLSLRETAWRCGVSLYTAWFMRMRVCEIMAYRLAPARPGSFQIDDTHFVKSLSGNHKHSAWYDIPRKPHRNGHDGKKAGGARTKNRISVSCGINEFGDCFCELVCEGVISASQVGLLISNKLPTGSTVMIDGDLSYASALREIPTTTIVQKDPSQGNINMVNALHSRLKEFMRSFHGVAARRMQRYLGWFCWREQFKRSDIDKRNLLFSHESEGRYMYTRAMTHEESRPFLPYWDKCRYDGFSRHMSMVV